MINPLRHTGLAQAIEAARLDRVKTGAPAVKTSAAVSGGKTVATPAAALVAEGAPFDDVKVGQIRAALAAGTYRVDPRAIAAAMVSQDLPEKGE